jgi:hypothetical protein
MTTKTETPFIPTEVHDITVSHTQSGSMRVEETGYVDHLGDRLVVHEGVSDFGQKGWFVSEYLVDREFVTPKVFFTQREQITQQVIDSIAKADLMTRVEIESPAPRTRNDVRAEFFTEDDNAVRLTANTLLKALNEKDFATARYELESLAQAHIDLENMMDEIVGQEPVEGDDPVEEPTPEEPVEEPEFATHWKPGGFATLKAKVSGTDHDAIRKLSDAEKDLVHKLTDKHGNHPAYKIDDLVSVRYCGRQIRDHVIMIRLSNEKDDMFEGIWIYECDESGEYESSEMRPASQHRGE